MSDIEKARREQAGTSSMGRAEKPPFFGGWERALQVAGVREQEKKENDVSLLARKNERKLETAKGTIRIFNYCPAEELEKLVVESGIFMFSRHDPGRQKQALVNVAKSEGGNVIVGVKDGALVSYIGIHLPSERERWGKPGYPWLFEMGAIEVSRSFRQLGLAKTMLEVAFHDPFYDDKIVLTTGYMWHWDLEGTGMNKMEYHALGVDLMGRQGFMEMVTDEPNVAMDQANLFMVRMGKNTSFSRYQRFASMLFANEWEAMLRGF